MIYADYRIEPIPVTQDQIYGGELASIPVEMARREGIVIYADDEMPVQRLDESGILLKTRGS